MDSKSLIQDALNLSPAERLYIIEILSQSLSEPDNEIDKYWKDEVEKRLEAYKKGQLKTITYDELLNR